MSRAFSLPRTALAVAVVAGATGQARAAGPEPARALFALIVGVNASPDADVPPLQYADDDAARYLELFRALGARTYVLARLDASTRRLHPQAAAEAQPPRRAELAQAVSALQRDIAQARARGVRSTLYVLYAGHGDVSENGWYLTLEDGRLDGAALLSDVVERAGADQGHLIVDACHSYLLAFPRGAGGQRRPASGFVELEAASRAGRFGYLLSSSASGESHEWAGFEAGIFSHEVRSGLFGAADADGDGQVTYSEIAAFVARANAAVAADRYRPKVFARAPRDGDVLLDLRGTRDHELRLDGPAGAAHYLLEDGRGVRLLDFHGNGVTPVRLVRPPGEGALYLRRLDDGTEQSVPRRDGVVQLAALPRSAARAQGRGAVHDAFGRLFTLAFDGGAVTAWSRDADAETARFSEAASRQERALGRARLQRAAGVAAVGVGLGAAVAAALVARSANALHDDAPPGESQEAAGARNDRITSRNQLATGLAIGGAAAVTTGVLLLLWPRRGAGGAEPIVSLAASPRGGEMQARLRF